MLGAQKMQFRHPNLDILVSPRHRFYCITFYLVDNVFVLPGVTFIEVFLEVGDPAKVVHTYRAEEALSDHDVRHGDRNLMIHVLVS